MSLLYNFKTKKTMMSTEIETRVRGGISPSVRPSVCGGGNEASERRLYAHADGQTHWHWNQHGANASNARTAAQCAAQWPAHHHQSSEGPDSRISEFHFFDTMAMAWMSINSWKLTSQKGV